MTVIGKDRFDRQRLIPGWDQEALEKTRFLVAGAGALGNEVTKNLAMLGAQRLLLADMDMVEESNLNRTTFFSAEDVGNSKVGALKQKLERQYPHCNVEEYNGTLQEMPETEFASCDVVLGCVDNQEARFMLNSHAVYYRKPYVDGATDGLLGQVRVVVPPYTSCYECYLPTGAYQDIGERFSCTREQLEEMGLPEEHIPAVPTTTSIIAAIVVDEAVKVLMGMDVLRARGTWHAGIGSPIDGVLQYDARMNKHNVVTVDKNPKCHICGREGIRASEDSPVRLKATARLTLKGLQRKVARHMGVDESFMLLRGLKPMPDAKTFFQRANNIEVKVKLASGRGHDKQGAKGGRGTGDTLREEGRIRELRRLASKVPGRKGQKLLDEVGQLKAWLRGEKALAEYAIEPPVVLTVVQLSSTSDRDFNLFLD